MTPCSSIQPRVLAAFRILLALVLLAVPFGHGPLSGQQLPGFVQAPYRVEEIPGNLCSPSELPFDLSFLVTNTPTSGGEIQLQITVTPTQDLDLISLGFITDGVVSLRNSLDRDLTNLKEGVPVTFNGILDINSTGSGALLASTGFSDQTPCGVSAREADEWGFFVVDDGTTVYTGSGAEIIVELVRVQALLDAAAITQEEAEDMIEDLVTAAGDPDDETSGAESIAGGGNVVIQGFGRWKDSAGTVHPLRRCEVSAFILNGGNLVEVKTATADESGSFTLTMTPAELGAGPRSIFVRVYARNQAANVVNPTVAAGISRTYFRQRIFLNVADGTTKNNENFTFNNTTVRDRAASIADGMLVGSDYQNIVQGARPGVVPCNYPRQDAGTASFYSKTTNQITIHRSKPYAWDVLLHEYGHYLQDPDLFNLANSPGGGHRCNEDVTGRHGKDGGLRLAWGEGHATYLGIAAQLVTNAAALGVPNAGDTSYHSVSARTGRAWQYDNESRDRCVGIGEGVETNVSRILWDIADSAIDGDDEISLGHNAVWDQIRDAANRFTLNDAWTTFTDGKSAEEKSQYGKIWAQNQASAQLTAPVDGLVIGNAPPTFKWTKNKLNKFSVKFYDQDWNEIGDSGDQGDVSQWTPTQAEWDNIRNNPTETIFWIVEGQNSTNPVTGPYWSDCRKLGGVDFAFVIDDTGSMGEEIGGVRDALLNFLSTFDPNSTDTLFQLTTFKDGVSVREPTRVLATIQSQVSSLTASGGGDCPENSVGGLLQGTQAMKRGGTVLFATDADPRPGSDLNGLINHLRSVGARVNVLLSGTCSGYGPTGYQTWSEEDLARAEEEAMGPPPAGGSLNAVDVFSQVAAETGGTFAFIPEVNSSSSGAVEYQNTAENILAASVGPQVVLVTPASVRLGSTASLTIQGQNTNFLGNSKVSFSDAGIQVLSIEALDPVTVVAQVLVDSGTATGFHDVTVRTNLSGSNQEVAEGFGVVQVLDASVTPLLVTANPSTAEPGQEVDVQITGLNTNFDDTPPNPSVSVVDFGAGITVNQVTIVSATELVANLTVDAAASLGFRSVSVTTGAEVASSEVIEFFRVAASSPPIPIVDSVVPSTAKAGTTLDLTIEVSGFTPEEQGTNVEFSGNGIETLAVQVCGSTIVATVRIASGAALGAQDVLVNSGGVLAAALNGFTTQAASAAGGSRNPFRGSTCSVNPKPSPDLWEFLLLCGGLASLAWLARRRP